MKSLFYSTSIIIVFISVLLLRQQLKAFIFDLVQTVGLQTSNSTLTTDQHIYATNMSVTRAISKVIKTTESGSGAGARVRTSIGSSQLRNLSPFLLLDHAIIRNGAGFPDHPHRGQETITYLMQGALNHEDFAGNKGRLEAGDLQFMTAGRGIVHAEMPAETVDGQPVKGLQLWVDLPEKLKDVEPRYRDLKASEIPSVDVDDGKVHVKVISGQSHGVDSVKDLAYTPVWLLDIEIKPGGKIVQPVPEGWTTFAYFLEGEALVGPRGNQTPVSQYSNVVFQEDGDVVQLEVDPQADSNARLVLVAGTPLDQPIVQYGPFVVTSKDQVYKAMVDYQTYSNGFERAKDWQSEIGKPLM
jgi:quercetin 2,3-dioxygenase